METSLRLRGADSTAGLRIHAKQKLPLASNALLQGQAEIDTSTRKPSHLALLARYFFPQFSANVGVGVQVEERPLITKKKQEKRNIFMYSYSLRGKKAVSFTSDGLLGLNIKGRFLADKDFKPRTRIAAVELAWTILDFRKGQDIRLKAGYELYRKVSAGQFLFPVEKKVRSSSVIPHTFSEDTFGDSGILARLQMPYFQLRENNWTLNGYMNGKWDVRFDM